jgi:hypothetical protein
MNLLAKRDLWAGLLLIALGTIAVAFARHYPFGSALRMGPGYLPVVLGVMLIVFGIAIAALGVVKGGGFAGSWSLRALIVLPLALAAFGALIDRGGFVPAMMVLVFGACAATREFRPLEALTLAVGLTVMAVLVFVWGLGLPYPLIVGLG